MNRIEKIKRAFLSEISFFMVMPAVLWQILFVLVPLFFIIAMSFISSGFSSGPMHFTFDHYRVLFDLAHLKIIAYSLLLAFSSATGCLLIAYPIAYFLALKVRNFKKLFLFLLIIPFWSNLLILVYAWFFILDKNGLLNYFLTTLGIINSPVLLLNSLWSVGLVMLYCYLPFMVMPIFSTLEKLDLTLIEASLDLGATQWQTFLHIIFPLSYSGVRTGYFLVFVVAFGEFVIPLLMGGDKYLFVGNAISQYILNSFDFSRGSAFTFLAGIVLMVSIFIMNILLKALFLGLKGKKR